MLKNRPGIRLVSLVVTIVMVLGNSVEVWALRPKAVRQTKERSRDTRRSPFERPGTPYIKQGPDSISTARQDRSEKEIRFDAYADAFYRLERQIRLVYQGALQAFIDQLKEISTQIEVPAEIDELNQLPKALQSEKLRSKIRHFENRFREAYQSRDDQQLTELNREIVNLLQMRLKVQLQLAVNWLEVAKSERRRLVAAINSIRGARSTCKRISIEYSWQRRRETKAELIKKIKTVGYYGTIIETFLYKDLDIKVYAPDEEHPKGRVIIRQQRWVIMTLPDGTKLKERQWYDVPYEDWPAGLRSQIHTLASQEIDYETVLHYLGDLEYCSERLSEYREKLPIYIREQIEESLSGALLWAKRGFVDGKRLGSENLEFALAKLKEDAVDTVLKELDKAIENLFLRLQEIEDIRKGVNRRLESIYFYIRNSDIKEKLTLAKEKLTAYALEETEDLVSELYQTYFVAEVEEGSYKYLRGKISSLSNAIGKLKEISQQEKAISNELSQRKKSHNNMQDQLKWPKLERDGLQKRDKRRLLDEKGRARLEKLEAQISSLQKQLRDNQTLIAELNPKLLSAQRRYLVNIDALQRDIDSVAELINKYSSNLDRSGFGPGTPHKDQEMDSAEPMRGAAGGESAGDRLTQLQSDFIVAALEIKAEEVTGFINAEEAIHAAKGGGVFEDYVTDLNDLLREHNQKTKEEIKGRALIVGPNFFRRGGVTNALRAIAELSKAVKIAIYGENADKLKTLVGNQNIVTAKSLNAVLLELENKYGINSKDTVLLRSSEEALEGIVEVRQVVAKEAIPATLAISKALKELLGESVTPAFEKLLDKMVEAEIVEQGTLNENRQALLAMLEEGQAFTFSEDLITEKITEDAEVVRAKETIKEFMNKHI